LPAGGRWIRTIDPGTKEPVFLAEGELRDRARAAKNGCFFMRYRWFESISLQRGVRCELDTAVRRSTSGSLGPCDFKDFVAQSHTPNDHCVRFAVVVTFPDATLVTRRALPLTWAGLSPAGSRQLRLTHCYSFTAVDFHHILLASLPAHSLALRPAHSHGHRMS